MYSPSTSDDRNLIEKPGVSGSPVMGGPMSAVDIVPGVRALPHEVLTFQHTVNDCCACCTCCNVSMNIAMTNVRAISWTQGACFNDRTTDRVSNISRVYYKGVAKSVMRIVAMFFMLLVVWIALFAADVKIPAIIIMCVDIALVLIILYAFFCGGRGYFEYVFIQGDAIGFDDKLYRFGYPQAFQSEHTIRSAHAGVPCAPLGGDTPMDALPYEKVLWSNNRNALVTNLRVVTAIQPLCEIDCVKRYLPRTFCVDRLQDVTRVRMAKFPLFDGAVQAGLTLWIWSCALIGLAASGVFPKAGRTGAIVVAVILMIIGVLLIILRRSRAGITTRAMERMGFSQTLGWYAFAFGIDALEAIEMEAAIRNAQETYFPQAGAMVNPHAPAAPSSGISINFQPPQFPVAQFANMVPGGAYIAPMQAPPAGYIAPMQA
jgi:hypothetical protein